MSFERKKYRNNVSKYIWGQKGNKWEIIKRAAAHCISFTVKIVNYASVKNLQ